MANIFDTITPVKQLNLKKGEYLFHQGSAVEYLYLIHSGCIHMLRHTSDGKESVMYEGRSGDTFAEASLFSDYYHCAAVAVQSSTIAAYDKRTLQEHLHNNPQLSITYMSQLARQIQQLRTHLQLRNINRARDRIYQFLLLSADPTGKVVLNSSLKDLACQLGLAHETFYRELARMEMDNLITREAEGSILISDV